MRLHEYQATEVFAEAGMPTPESAMAASISAALVDSVRSFCVRLATPRNVANTYSGVCICDQRWWWVPSDLRGGAGPGLGSPA